ncbi:MAG TPA: antibiotic biosynthesis monooxygenase family protein [Trebonia sp.]|jgi:heme-degrading monooxygenase HmoA
MSQPLNLTDALVTEPVTLINAWTVPPDESERFLDRWKENARIMASQQGFIRARMFCALADDAELRFINVAEWDSGAALDKARANPEWRASAQREISDPDLHIIPRPAVYQVAVEVHPGDLL